jgi:hypothetical protein
VGLKGVGGAGGSKGAEENRWREREVQAKRKETVRHKKDDEVAWRAAA